MRQVIFTWALAIAFGLSASVAEAIPLFPMPLFPMDPVAGSPPNAILLAVSKSQTDYAYRQCQRKFGYRFVRVKIQGNRYICQYRDSNATVTKKALKRCANLGASLKRVTKIYIRGNRYIARMICLRRQRGI